VFLGGVGGWGGCLCAELSKGKLDGETSRARVSASKRKGGDAAGVDDIEVNLRRGKKNSKRHLGYIMVDERTGQGGGECTAFGKWVAVRRTAFFYRDLEERLHRKSTLAGHISRDCFKSRASDKGALGF